MFYTGVLACTNKDYVSIRNSIINHCNHLERMSFLRIMKDVSFVDADTSTMTPVQSSLYNYFKTGVSVMNIPSYPKNITNISIDKTNIVFNNDTNTIFVSIQTDEPTLDSGFQNFILTLIDDTSWPTRTGRNKTIKGAHFVTVENNAFDTILLEGINPPSITDYFNWMSAFLESMKLLLSLQKQLLLKTRKKSKLTSLSTTTCFCCSCNPNCKRSSQYYYSSKYKHS